jgi:predicted DNA binding CopG/RHH family protein
MKLDKKEQELLDSIENNEWVSTNNKDKIEENLIKVIKNQKKKAISIRLAENDIYEIKKKSLELGVPYQNLIQTLIHQYVNGNIKVSI